MTGANRHRSNAEHGAAATAPSSSRRRGPRAAPAVILLALLIAGAGLLGWHTLRRADRRPQVDSPAFVPEGPRPDSGQPPPTSPGPADKPTAPEPLPVTPDLPPPATAEELVGEVTAAIDDFVQSRPDDPDALEIQARVHYYLGDSPAAVACWNRCLELQPGYAYAHHGLGLVAAKKADYEEAVARHRKAWELAPGIADIAVALADALMKQNEPDEAVEVLTRHLEVGSPSASAWLVLGEAYLHVEQFQKAHDAYRKALAIQAELPRAQFGLATSLARLGRREAARRAMERHKELAAQKVEFRTNLRSRFDDLAAMRVDLAGNLTNAGRVCLARGDLVQAERLCRRAATLDPKNPECRMMLASLYQQGRRGDEAVRMCRQLVEIEPENAAYRLNLGMLYGSLGRFEEAEEALRQAIRLAPQAPQARAALARLYLRSQRKLDEATRLAEKAVELAPENPKYRRTLDRLKQAP